MRHSTGMTFTYSAMLLLAVATILNSNSLLAQNAARTSRAPLKKTVYRQLNMATKEDKKVHHLRDVTADTSLFEMIINEIRAGKLTAYSNYDHNFTTKMTVKELNDYIVPGPDTVNMLDPITGKEMTKIIVHEPDYEGVQEYRLLEEWTFNPTTGNTDIHIAGVAPLKGIVNQDGTFRGMLAVFWVRYNELTSVLARYENIHPGNSFALHIWDDYFLSDVKPGEKK